MASVPQAAGDVAFVDDARRINTQVATQLFGRSHLAALILFWRRGLSSFALRIRGRRLFRGVRHAALWCWGVGDDVEIVGHGLHGGSSFC
jgi:hypothetical protein